MDKVFRENDLTPKGPRLAGRSAPAALGLRPMGPEGPGLCPITHKNSMNS